MPDAPHCLTATFDAARDVAACEKIRLEHFDLRQTEIKLSDGILDPDQVSRLVNPARILKTSQTSGEKKRKADGERVMFMMLLDDMRQRLADLDASLAQRYETLRGKYGDDVIGGMADTFLSAEQKAGLETDEDKMAALADKFLNPDGTIKDEYKDLEEAKYVRDWQEAQKLRPIVAKYDGRNDLSAAERREVYAVAQSVGIAAQNNMYLQSENHHVRDTVEQAMDEKRADNESVTNTTTFGFAKPT